MKKLISSIALISFCVTLLGQNVAGTINSDEGEYFNALDDIFSVPPTDSPIEIQGFFGLTGPVLIPEFGMNGQITYPSGDLLSQPLYNLGTPSLQQTISVLSPTHLRFPGGQLANSFNLYTKHITLNETQTGDILNSMYYIDDVPNIALPDGTLSHFLFEEGSYNKKGGYMELDINSNANDYNFLLDRIDNLRLILKFSSSQYAITNDGAFTENSKWNVHEFNYLKDFVHITQSQEITPVYVLRMLDPLNFVMRTANNERQFSPYLMNQLGATDYTVDNLGPYYGNSLNTLYDTANNYNGLIADSSRAEIRRQMVKYIYEYLKYYDANHTFLPNMQSYLQGVGMDAGTFGWNNFVTQFSALRMGDSSLDTYFSELNLHFELGNELWLAWEYKFLPPLSGFDPNAELYGRLCINAVNDIKSVFPNAKVGAVADNRKDCSWSNRIITEISGDSNYDDIDAWVLHYYSKYNGDLFVYPPISDNNEAIVSSPISNLMLTMHGDHFQGGSQLSTKRIWVTEFNVKHESLYEHYGTWFDLISKFNLLNQHFSRPQQFRDAIPQPDNFGLTDLYNLDAMADPAVLNTDFILLHTLSENLLPTVTLPTDPLDPYHYTGQGLMAVIMDRFTRDNHRLAQPIIFENDPVNNPPSDLALTTSNSANATCYEDDMYHPQSQLVWGWMVQKEDAADCPSYRYLLVNTSNEHVNINNIPDYNRNNMDLFLFNIDDCDNNECDLIDVTGNLLANIQDPTISGEHFDNGFTYFTGTQDYIESNTNNSNFDNGIHMPPYSIYVLDGSLSEALLAGSTPISNTVDILPAEYYEIDNQFPVTIQPPLSGEYYVGSDIVIKSGGTLIINSGTTLNMRPGIGIQIDPGGFLDVNGATITACDGMWKGIFVKGASAPQSYSTHGRLRLRNSPTLSHAENAINNFGMPGHGGAAGGIIQAYSGTVFNNNTRDVNFRPFTNTANGSPTRDLSVFTRCDFLTDDAYRGTEARPHMKYFNTHGVQIKGCDFSDSRTGLVRWAKRNGINLSKATVDIDEHCATLDCTNGTPSTFTDLFQGVYSAGGHLAVFHTQIKKSVFDCWTGTTFSSTRGAEIENNTFTVTPNNLPVPSQISPIPVGLYMGNSNKQYLIEGNSFDSDYGSAATTALGSHSVGMVVSNGHGNEEQVYKNTFSDMTVGIEALGRNKGEDGPTQTGLQILCNEFQSNRTDIFVTSTTPSAAYQGIKAVQGPTENILAFNAFELNLGTQVHIQNNQEVFSYRYALDEEPMYNALVKQPQGSVIPLLEVFADDIEDRCPSGNTTILAGLANQGNSFNSYQSSQLLVEQVADGGNTEALQLEVVTATTGTAYQKYLELMVEAGYLSKTVLRELSSKEDGFSDAMIRNVMVANPKAAKDAEVNERLDERSNPMPEYMRDQIDEGKYLSSPLEQLERTRDGHLYDYTMSTAQVYRGMIADSLYTDSLTALVSLLHNTGILEYDYLLYETYKAKGELNLANALLAVMKSRNDLSDEEELSLIRFENFQVLTDSWDIERLDQLNEETIAQLVALKTVNDQVGNEAMALLELNEIEKRYYDVQLPLDAVQRTISSQNSERIKEGMLDLFPNPSSGIVHVNYRIDKAFKQAEYILADSQGKRIVHGPLIHDENQIILDLDLSTGTYLVEIRVDAQNYRTEILIVK